MELKHIEDEEQRKDYDDMYCMLRKFLQKYKVSTLMRIVMDSVSVMGM